MEKGHIPEAWYRKCREYYAARYPELWERMAREWWAPGEGCRFWLTGPSSYWIRMGGVRFAVDPVWTIPGTFEALLPRIREEVGRLDFILLTHEHIDHFNPDQAAKLADAAVLWLVPSCMRTAFLSTGVSPDRCVFLRDGDTREIGEVCVEALEGHHHYLDGRKGPDSLMYVIRYRGRRFFLPGDVRDYRPESIPAGSFDSAFLHLYLGPEPYDYPLERYYQQAVAYAAAIPASRMFLTHLYGFHFASPDQIWTFGHAGMLLDGLFCLRPELETVVPRIGEGYDL